MLSCRRGSSFPKAILTSRSSRSTGPSRRTRLDPATLNDLAAAWRRIAGDPAIRCAVLTGAGTRIFCSGMDMKTTIPASQRFARGERIQNEEFEGLRSVATALLAGFDLGKPLVCAVNGHARAGGFDLMLAAEIRYAVPHATFALEEVALGLYPTGNATVLLPRQIAWVHAQELLLTARPIDAARAAEIGLVNRVVPAARADARPRSRPPTRSPPTRRSRCARRAAACASSCTSRSTTPGAARRRSAARCAAPRTPRRRRAPSSRSGARCGRGASARSRIPRPTSLPDRGSPFTATPSRNTRPTRHHGVRTARDASQPAPRSSSAQSQPPPRYRPRPIDGSYGVRRAEPHLEL